MNEVVVSSHRYRKKFYVISIPCSCDYNTIILSDKNYSILMYYNQYKSAHIDRILCENEFKNIIRLCCSMITKNPWNFLIRQRKSIKEFHKKISFIIRCEDMNISYNNKLYLLFENKNEYIKFKLKHM